MQCGALRGLCLILHVASGHCVLMARRVVCVEVNKVHAVRRCVLSDAQSVSLCHPTAGHVVSLLCYYTWPMRHVAAPLSSESQRKTGKSNCNISTLWQITNG